MTEISRWLITCFRANKGSDPGAALYNAQSTVASDSTYMGQPLEKFVRSHSQFAGDANWGSPRGRGGGACDYYRGGVGVVLIYLNRRPGGWCSCPRTRTPRGGGLLPPTAPRAVVVFYEAQAREGWSNSA